MYSQFCSTAFCNIAGIFIIPSSQKVLAFGQANIKPVSTSIAALKLYTMFLKCSHCTSARIQFPEMGLWKVLIFSLYIMSICNILINNLKSKTQFQLQNNWKWMVIKIIHSKNYERNLNPSMQIIRNKSWKFTIFVPILGT